MFPKGSRAEQSRRDINERLELEGGEMEGCSRASAALLLICEHLGLFIDMKRTPRPKWNAARSAQHISILLVGEKETAFHQ